MRLPGCRGAIVCKRGVGCGDDGRRGELRDGDVVRMSVCAVGPERDDDVGLLPPQVPDYARDGVAWVRSVEPLVLVGPAAKLADRLI
jgi:hypothetical protein